MTEKRVLVPVPLMHKIIAFLQGQPWQQVDGLFREMGQLQVQEFELQPPPPIAEPKPEEAATP